MRYIGLDVHKSFCQAAVVDEKGEIVEEKRIDTTKEAIEGFFRRYKGSKAVLESTGVWEYVYEAVQSCGVEAIVSNPLKTRMIAEAQIKTDKIDCRILAQLLRSNMIPESHVPDPEIREGRKDVRERLIMKKVSTSLKNHIYAELIRRGIKYKKGMIKYKSGRKWARETLAEPRLDQTFDLLEAVENAIKEYNHERLLPAYESNEKAQIVATMDGIGYYTALTIYSELGDVSRFPNSNRVVSYCGLNPRVHQSSTTLRMGPITKQGPAILRWILIEAAHCHLMRCRNKSECRLCQFYKRISRKRGKNKAIVALAAKMARTIYWMLKLNQPYRSQGLNPAMFRDGERRFYDWERAPELECEVEPY